MLLFIGFTLLLQVSRALSEATRDYRHISYDDLSGTTLFQQEGVSTYSQLLFDVARQQVIVGARDNLYCLTLNSLTPLEHVLWPSSDEKISQCQNKGQSADACHNYVKVLLSNGKRLFACGTNAFSPLCSWREIENINNVTSLQSGIAMCPYSPHSNVTALLVRGPSGGLFAGTPTEFSGNDAAIYRTIVLPNLRTRQYDSKWLNEPQFVGSFETEDYIYFLFRESAVEYINCGKRVYSRIGRVCKYDPGSTMLMKDTWTTFSKARLNCSLPGEFPFYYDEIQGAVFEPEQGVVYATFTTPSNAIAGSAICAFNMSAILAAFEGPFKHQENSGAAWERKHQQNRQKCGPASSDAATTANSDRISDNQLYQLMDEAVQGITRKPLHTVVLERFTHLAVDVTATRSDKAVPVLYVATSEGLIKKISVLPKSTEACVVEIWGPLPSAPIVMQYLKETKSLYVGMQNALLRIPTVQCHRHLTAQSCLDAQDPYCGWDEHLLKCSGAPAESSSSISSSSHGLWRQDFERCPELEAARPGGWSTWGPVFSCPHGPESSPESGHCLCQERTCDNPRPRNGGSDCAGTRVRVTNCTQHGGWTAWSAWSSCGQSCGPAIKTRRRSCTNPAPAHGGRVCLGSEHEEKFCVELPPCPLPEQTVLRAWSNWGPWSACSRLCNGGTRTRTRSCEPQPTTQGDPSSLHDCAGCNFQIEECNKQPCQEIKKSYTSGWLLQAGGAVVVNSSSGRSERRYRFTCRAQADEPSSVKVQTKVEERYCRADGFCIRKPVGSQAPGIGAPGGPSEPSAPEQDTTTTTATWADWSSWSGCSQSCGGGGTQYRIRQCRSASCEAQGLQTESRACSGQPCEHHNNNHHHHHRGAAHRGSADPVPGNPPDFSDNDVNGPLTMVESSSSSSSSSNSVSFVAAATSCFAAFATGLLITALGIFYYLKNRKPPIPSSPHYISRQNPYVTVPLKEINTKRQPSFSGSINGTLRKNNTTINGYGSPKLYPKALEYESATLKRNSREQHLRAELDQEKYY